MGELKKFDMAFNYLSGTLPQTLLLSAAELNTLNFSGNVLGADTALPEDLGQMTALQILDLSTNQFIGTIPESIGTMKNLVELRLDRNFLTGQLPQSVNQLSNIEILSLSENSLSELPVDLTGLSKLIELQLSTNNLKEIPDEFFNEIQNLGTSCPSNSFDRRNVISRSKSQL